MSNVSIVYIHVLNRCRQSNGAFHHKFKTITEPAIIVLDRQSCDHEAAGREFRGARCSTLKLFCRKSTAIFNLLRPCSIYTILTATSILFTLLQPIVIHISTFCTFTPIYIIHYLHFRFSIQCHNQATKNCLFKPTLYNEQHESSNNDINELWKCQEHK